ncbi:hypothetical protein SAMN06269185_3270 [Natronoarchaeum philippinense]|uniref:Uncharacterized protein n=1 Tax=Natronoarchaeum philippinense TaxID=558529 RepID=A0A285P8T0_NATPI|nr:hypothetical protein [Natronoarchaeum philippinense]SNZ18159.1 hypothetical protein SAMN06269185_3270 [Natronoarchaeum philippinense]
MAKSITDVAGRTYGEARYKEGEAGSDLTPGELLVQTGTNADGEPIYDAVSTVDKLGPEAQFAMVPSTPPARDVSDADPIEQTIPSGTLVEVRVFTAGETVQNALLASGSDLATASNANVSPGDRLGSNDDGSLKITTTGGAAVAVAREANDNSGAAAGERARLNVEVL